MGFPVTSDGAAVAQFFRGLEPNDMPVGGTSISKALDQARELLRRDPKAKDHRRFVILITDGEDLEGSPRNIAASLGEDGTTIYVVQIGGRTPERIPDIAPDGTMNGYRKNEAGQDMTTELTPRREAARQTTPEATKTRSACAGCDVSAVPAGVTVTEADARWSRRNGCVVACAICTRANRMCGPAMIVRASSPSLARQ